MPTAVHDARCDNALVSRETIHVWSAAEPKVVGEQAVRSAFDTDAMPLIEVAPSMVVASACEP